MVQIGSHYIQNRWIKGSGDMFTSLNPATGKPVWEGHKATTQEVTFAIKSAREALENPAWKGLKFEDRCKIVVQFQEKLTDEKDQFAETISKETGKPLWETKQEVAAMINKIPISIDAFEDRCRTVIQELPGKQVKTQFKPHGVVGVLGPFNFPGHLPNGHIIPALLAGNTVVFKPSDQTPLVGQEYMKLWENIALPEGVLNCVQGDGSVGQLISTHPDINGLFFTGSAVVGKQLATLYAKSPQKILALEMGGNNPLIIDQISDIRSAVYTTIQSAYITAGQRCTCARRLIIVNSKTSKDFLELLTETVKQIQVGEYTNSPEPFMGPVISLDASTSLLSNEEWLTNMGAKRLVKLDAIDPEKPFLKPGLIDVGLLSNLPDEEYFGPLLRVINVKTLESAISHANRTEFGLSAGIISEDRASYEKVYNQVRAGIINWNAPTTGASSKAPFGGVGISGNFRPSAYFAADYCAYPVVSTEIPELNLPETLSPGLPQEQFKNISKKKPKKKGK